MAERRRRIRITVDHHFRAERVAVLAWVFGDWAVHLWRDLWTVTHVPTGSALCIAHGAAHGRHIARRLRAEVDGASLPDAPLGLHEFPLLDAKDRDAICDVLDETMPSMPDGPVVVGGPRG